MVEWYVVAIQTYQHPELMFQNQGTDTQLWPAELHENSYDGLNCSSSDQKFGQYSHCASAGFYSMYRLFTSNLWTMSPFDFTTQDFLIRKTLHLRPGETPNIDSWVYTAHHATASVQDALRHIHHNAVDWFERHMPYESPYYRLHWAESVKLEMKTKVPAVRVQCIEQTEAFISLSGPFIVRFPRLDEYKRGWRWSTDEELTANPQQPRLTYDSDLFDMTDEIKRHLFERGLTKNRSLPLNDTEIFAGYRRVIVIPHDIWNNTGSSLGFLIFLDGNSDVDKPAAFNALACSVDARWSKGKSIITSGLYRQPPHDFDRSVSRLPVSVELDSDSMRTLHTGKYPFDPPQDGSLSTIRLHKSWYNVVSPILPDDVLPVPDPLFRGGKEQSGFERVLDTTYAADHLDFLGQQRREFENVLSIMVLDGVSRSGSFLNRLTSRAIFNATGDRNTINGSLARTMVRHGDPVESFPKPLIFEQHNTTKVMVRAFYEGYALSSSSSWFNWFCIALLLTHAVLALAHSVWVVFIQQQSSNAWDTIPELVALAQKSDPPLGYVLENTSAGARSLRTSGIIAWVEAVQQGKDQSVDGKLENGPLRLVLSDAVSTTGRESSRRPLANSLYN